MNRHEARLTDEICDVPVWVWAILLFLNGVAIALLLTGWRAS